MSSTYETQPVADDRYKVDAEDTQVIDTDAQVKQSLWWRKRAEYLSKAQKAAERTYRRNRSVVYRLKYHIAPFTAAAAALTAAAIGWGLNSSYGGSVGDQAVRGMVIAGVMVAASLLMRRKHPVWCPRRVNTATAVGALWIVLAVTSGWSLLMLTMLAVLTTLISIGYWRDIYIPDTEEAAEALDADPVDVVSSDAPTGDQSPAQHHQGGDGDTEEREVDQDQLAENRRMAEWMHGRWDYFVAGLGKDCKANGIRGHLPGVLLEDVRITDTQIEWDVAFPENATMVNDAILENDTLLKQIAGVFQVPAFRIQTQPHPSGSTLRAILTVVVRSDCEDGKEVTEPTYHFDGENGWIDFGSYLGASEPARLQLYSRHSAHNALILGSPGSGKTSLMNQISLSMKSSGHTSVIYLDGSYNGVSSPLLQKYADWAPSGKNAEEEVLSGLERAMAERGLYREYHGLQGLTPSPEMPGIVVMIDECQVFFTGDNEHRWLEIIRQGRKYCIAIIAATQDSGGDSFGTAALRDMLSEVTTIGLVGKGTDRGIGINLDTSDLPSEPGWGRMSGRGALDLPLRTWELKDDVAERLFREQPDCSLDRLTANAFGEPYTRRHERAAEHRELVRMRMEAVERGEVVPPMSVGGDDDSERDVDLSGLDLDSAAEKLMEAMAPFQGDEEEGDGYSPPARAVLAEVRRAEAAGRPVTRAQLRNTTGYANSSVSRAVEELTAAGLIEQSGHGAWRAVSTE